MRRRMAAAVVRGARPSAVLRSCATARRLCRLYEVPSSTPVDYMEALRLQRALQRQRLAWQRAGVEGRDVVLLLEHSSVYTLGRRGRAADVRVLGSATEAAEMDEALRRGPVRTQGHLFVRTDRGGKVTWHGPGQLVCYLLLDLRFHRRDLHWYLARVQDALMEALRAFGLEPCRDAEHTGVWLGDEKVAAIGINATRWVTMHGVGLNVAPRMAAFDAIVPCGIEDRGVTSLAAALGKDCPDMTAVRGQVVEVLTRVFALDVERREVNSLAHIAEAEELPEDSLAT